MTVLFWAVAITIGIVTAYFLGVEVGRDQAQHECPCRCEEEDGDG